MQPIRVYGSRISYFTGKLEAYLRYKGLPYERLPLLPDAKRIRTKLGTTQMPAVELPDGRWMSDSTPIIQYFETQNPATPILPDEQVLRFIALLIEDYADEWLWRPAMHYRWSYRHSRELASSILVDEQLEHLRMPRFWKKRLIIRRQLGSFVIDDGVSKASWDHVESGYFKALDNMTRMLDGRSFLLGDTPSIADFGLMGPMFRHFGQDPTPVELMRERAPAVYEWVARMWNTSASNAAPTWIDTDAAGLEPMLQEICETHLDQLAQNAGAFKKGDRRFDGSFQGCPYRNLPVSRYRVWCLEVLRRHFADLDEGERGRLRSLLHFPQAEILWTKDFSVQSHYDEEGEAPFNRAINVYAEGIPK